MLPDTPTREVPSPQNANNRWQMCEERIRTLYRLGNPYLLGAAERTMPWLAEPRRRNQLPREMRGRLLVALELALRRARGWRDRVADPRVKELLLGWNPQLDAEGCRVLLVQGFHFFASEEAQAAPLADRAALWVCLGATHRRLESLAKRSREGVRRQPPLA